MKKILITTAVMALTANLSFSQNLTTSSPGQPLRVNNKDISVGTPYFNPDFVPSTVQTTAKKDFKLKALRYNVYLQQLEYLDNDRVYTVQDSIAAFTIADSTGKDQTFIKSNVNNKNIFLQEVVTGKAELLKLYTAKPSTSEDWYTKKKTKTIVHTVKYYSRKDGVTKEITKSQKDLLTLFSDKQEAVKSYLAKSNTDLKSETDLTALFSYYNSLN